MGSGGLFRRTEEIPCSEICDYYWAKLWYTVDNSEKKGADRLDYPELLQKKEQYQASKASIPEYTLFTFEQAFEVEYTHNSTAIEGNTLTLIETKVLLEDGISIGGKNLREIYESVNHRKAYRYVKDCISKGMPLEEKIIKDIHAMLMENILVGGIYRNVDVYISGAQHTQ